MKNKKHIQDHPNQENKSGQAPYSSSTKRNSSTNKTITNTVNMPRGTESDYQGRVTPERNNQHSSKKAETIKYPFRP
jgi:hypothetical protein